MLRQLDSVRHSPNFDSILNAARARFLQRTAGAEAAMADPDSALEMLRGDRPLGSLEFEEQANFDVLEAIILEKMRPPYFIEGDKIIISGEYDHVDLIVDNQDHLEKICQSVGRVDLFHHRTHDYVGTGWLIEQDTVVTNRHVASIFAKPAIGGGYRFQAGAFGQTIEARLDYVRQNNTHGIRRRADVLDILYISGPNEPDIAFLKVEKITDLNPLDLFTGKVERETPIAAVGYPAEDGGRNDPALMNELFGEIYRVKRFSPGLVTGDEDNGIIVLGDYTSLGGNSGSPVLRLQDGKVIGLHFAGYFREANYSVSAGILAAAHARVRTMIRVPSDFQVEAPLTSRPEAFNGRDGYDPYFLGTNLAVPLPQLGIHSDDVAPVSDNENGILKYRHFSVIQSKSRRLPRLTAVNIDGEKLIRLKRDGDWSLDGRLSIDHQIGNELYRNNRLDRGHMVRRRDPGWGSSRQEATEGELDTFHYTNSAPQHEDLNQREWLGLEDYILEAAETEGFKVSVFTGPVLRDDDQSLRNQPGVEGFKIPSEFWKIAVIRNSKTGALSATGYVLSHGPMIRNLVEAEFIFGAYKTYQLQIRRIERETGLDFGNLSSFDPLGTDTEASFGEVARVIGGPEDLILG